MQIKTLFSAGLILLLLSGCTGSKSYSKKGEKLQEAGMTNEAAGFFYEALVRNPKNIDARIGLKATGDKQINAILEGFYKAYSIKADRDAVYSYRDALRLSEKYGAFVDLEVPSYYSAYYDEVLTRYLHDRYVEANNFLDEEKFTEAENVLDEIISLDPDYKDAKDLGDLAEVEPLYRKGVREFENGKFRTCYGTMNMVLGIDNGYKDAIDYKERALEKGTITVAVLPFESSVNASGAQSLSKSLYGQIVQQLVNSNNPFLKVIDRENTDHLLREQRLSIEGAVQNESAVSAGEMLGAKVLITGKVTSYAYNPGRVSSQKKQGFTAQSITRIDPVTKEKKTATVYKKTYYTEHQGSTAVNASFQFKAIDSETGEVIVSDVLSSTSADQVHFATFKGNKKALYKGSFKSFNTTFDSGDKVFKSSAQKRQFDAILYSQKTTLKSEVQLTGELSSSMSKGVYGRINAYNPDK
mgnify:CR=1 FL=1